MTNDATLAATDGRAARSLRTRAAIVEALLELIGEGEIQPTVEGIAERAGVAQRTVFQHYPDREALFTAACERQLERIEPLLDGAEDKGPLATRLTAFALRRADLFEQITPVCRATRHLAPTSPSCRRALDKLRRRERDETLRVFAGELARCPAAERRELEAALCAATGWTAWEILRAEEGLSVELAGAAMRRTLRALLARPG